MLCGAVSIQLCEQLVPGEGFLGIPRVGEVAVEIHFSNQEDGVWIIELGSCFEDVDRLLEITCNSIFPSQRSLLGGGRIHEQSLEDDLGVVPSCVQDARGVGRDDTVFPCWLELPQNRPDLMDSIVASVRVVDLSALVVRNKVGIEELLEIL
jgi:hypothetical protein